ncbi:MAG: RsmD family RNA methyltransferase, partial [Gaiellaceae bacterium]
MRIIAGSRRGARIRAPRGVDTRPTGDRVREAAFNMIGPLEGASVLDLFAGSGAMGLEALSRGAARVVFIESDQEACRAIKANLEKLRLTGATVL